MSVDKLVDSTQLDADLTSVANAIRTKGGTSASLAFPADFISAINAISGGGGTGYGVKGAATPLGLIYALEHNEYHTGTVTVSSYFPTNAESEFCDTGYGETYSLWIWIMDVLATPYVNNTQNLFECLGYFTKPAESGADFGSTGGYAFIRYRGGTTDTMFGNRMTSYRMNNGKLYIKPAYAQTNYTYFAKGHTYRWIAFPQNTT